MESVVKALVKPLARIPLIRSLVLVLGGLFFGFGALVGWTEAVRYSLEGRPATAQVEKYSSGRRGSGDVELTYEAEGQPVKARMHTEFFYSPKPGEQVPILYQPDRPYIVHPDSFWRRFLIPVAGTVFSALMLLIGLWDLRSLFRFGASGSPGENRPAEPEQGGSPEGRGTGTPSEKGTAFPGTSPGDRE